MCKWRLKIPIFLPQSPVLAGVGVRTSKYPYMDICELFSAISSHFQSCLAISSYFHPLKPFPGTPAIFTYSQQFTAIFCHFSHSHSFPAIYCCFQPFPAIYSNFQPFHSCSAIPAVSSNFQPFQAIFSHY